MKLKPLKSGIQTAVKAFANKNKPLNLATHFHSLRVIDIRRETPDAVSIAFEVPGHLEEEFKFVPGQNLTIRLKIGEEEIRRSYSICSSPSEQELRIAVKKVQDGKFSAYANNILQVGDMLDVLPPTGMFLSTAKESQSQQYLAIAAGSGITPVISIIKATLATEPNSHFTLIYGNRNRQSVIFKDLLHDLKNRYMDRFSLIHIFSREKTDADINQGRIDENKLHQLNKLVQFGSMNEVFLCGPEEMIHTSKKFLEQLNIQNQKIHFELFHAPGTLASKSHMEGETDMRQQHCEAEVRLDGISFIFDLPYDGESVLDGALAKGADLPYSCKGGVCATCKAKLLEGKVEMDTNYALEPEEVQEGYILTCQSHPRSKRIVVDFDAR